MAGDAAAAGAEEERKPLWSRDAEGFKHIRSAQQPNRFQARSVFQVFFLSLFAYYFLYVGTFTSFSKDIKSFRSHKTVGIKTDPMDSNPEHCLYENACVPRQRTFQNISNRGPVPLKICVTLIYDE